MDNSQFQTSFIPKKPIMDEPLRHVARPMQRSISIFTVIAIASVVLVGGAYTGLYFYKISLTAQIESSKKSLALAKESFEPETIADLQLFDKRIAASKQVLASHIVVSPFFELLNSLTLPSIQFTKFSAEGGTDGDSFVVKMSGNAKDYKSIAVQASLFNSSAGKYFKDVVFSNLTLSDDKDKKGYVTFNVSFVVDPVLLSYEKQILKYTEKNKEVTKPTPANDSLQSNFIKDILPEDKTNNIVEKVVEPKTNINKINP
ncbi:PilN domain-containing protein [Candidatus Nomurabacteria bacterium]|nr:PilN domain-containing protein [Candidatus Nomurabacteria bacterium]